jgi:hypothetical protein
MLYHVIVTTYRLHHELHILGFFTPVQKPYSTPCIDMCTVRSSQYPPHIPINHPEWLGHSLLMTITFILSENPSLGFLLYIIPPKIIPPSTAYGISSCISSSYALLVFRMLVLGLFECLQLSLVMWSVLDPVYVEVAVYSQSISLYAHHPSFVSLTLCDIILFWTPTNPAHESHPIYWTANLVEPVVLVVTHEYLS